ncbi:MAG: hypothetical protein GX790_05735 [Syntrophomonadaceae bacterium]|nr:hypothetical protein [Syntrophomonadaceae bacterium]
MKKCQVLLILLLTLVGEFLIAPVTLALEGYIRTEELLRLSEEELQKLREEAVIDYIDGNPDVVMEREFTDDEIQKVREQNRERIEELILKKQLQLEPEDNAELINISTNETLNVVLTPNLILLIEDLVSSLVKFHPHSIMVLTEQVEQVLNNILMEKQALTSKA